MADNLLINKPTTNFSERILFPEVSLLLARTVTDILHYTTTVTILTVKYRLTFSREEAL